MTMEATILTLSVLAFLLSISRLGIILLYYCCCREVECNKYIDHGGFPVKYDNTSIRGSIGSIALEQSNKQECEMDNMSDHHYEEDLYIDDTIEDQKKYLDKTCGNDQERIYYTLKDLNNSPCECKGACYHIYH